MDTLQIVLTALFSLVILFLLTKLMGNKQVSQMNMFDYIVGITIGSIAAEMATELEEPLQPAIAMVVYALVAVGITLWDDRMEAVVTAGKCDESKKKMISIVRNVIFFVSVLFAASSAAVYLLVGLL